MSELPDNIFTYESDCSIIELLTDKENGMAQVELKFFSDIEREIRIEIAKLIIPAVAKVHYDLDFVSPGDVTLVVPVLDVDLSESDADFELEISEGSDNWPKTDDINSFHGLDMASGSILMHDSVKQILDERAKSISAALLDSERLRVFSHNIFEVTGIATGWLQYKPEQSS